MTDYLIIFFYWVIFWRKFLSNPYILCTSEIASTYFPHWIWMGRSLNKGWFKDNIYYKYPGSIPFLSSFYPPKIVTAFMSRYLTLDRAFKLYSLDILLHSLLTSITSYFLFLPMFGSAALFGSLTLTYAAYSIKPQTPAFMYTAAWLPAIFMDGPVAGLAFGMVLLAGYYPIVVYMVPAIIFWSLYNPWVLLGLVIGLPQIIPFLFYWNKSVRSLKDNKDMDFKLLPRELINFFFKINDVTPKNGVHYPEFSIYLGMIPLFTICLSDSRFWLLLIYSLLVVMGIFPKIQRIRARALYAATFSIALLSAHGIMLLSEALIFILTLFQSYQLLQNNSIYPSFPFSQYSRKPSVLYSSKRDTSKFPFQSGYLFEDKTDGYRGGFSLINK